jgi:hypothetical protein
MFLGGGDSAVFVSFFADGLFLKSEEVGFAENLSDHVCLLEGLFEVQKKIKILLF